MKTKTLYEIAMPEANQIVNSLFPHCERIAIAGSLRRNKAEVGDIEIVAIPLPIQDMFGIQVPLETDHALNHVDYSKFGKLVSNGNKMKKVQLECGLQLDLFIVTPPAQWGVIFLIRTGPAEYSQRFVTKRGMGGMLPGHMRVDGGALWENNTLLETPDEEDVYNFIGLPYVEPKDR